MFPRIRVGPRAQHRILSQFSTLEEINPLQTTLYEWGIVSMRVGFVLRSAEIKPLFFDLFRSNKFFHNQRTVHTHTPQVNWEVRARAFLLPPPHRETRERERLPSQLSHRSTHLPSNSNSNGRRRPEGIRHPSTPPPRNFTFWISVQEETKALCSFLLNNALRHPSPQNDSCRKPSYQRTNDKWSRLPFFLTLETKREKWRGGGIKCHSFSRPSPPKMISFLFIQ